MKCCVLYLLFLASIIHIHLQNNKEVLNYIEHPENVKANKLLVLKRLHFGSDDVTVMFDGTELRLAGIIHHISSTGKSISAQTTQI